jgi:hypothetical protein
MHTALVLAAIAAVVTVAAIWVTSQIFEGFRILGTLEEKQVRTVFLLNAGYPVAEERSHSHNRGL